MSDPCSVTFSGKAKENNCLKPVSSGEEMCAPGHFWGAGVRGNYVIHYVISGSGVFYCGTNKFNVKKGQIFVIFPNTVVKYQADFKDPWHYAWVVFSGDEVKKVFDHAGIDRISPVFTMPDTKRVAQVLRDMPEERGTGLFDDLKFSSLLYEFLSMLVSEDDVEKSENIYISAAVRYIKAHYPEDITVDRIAAHLGISRKYLFTIFKKSMGISTKDYIVDYRMKKACELLGNDDLSIGNVAYSVGYKDALTFSRMFKSKIGVSPTEYREK